MLKIYFFTLTMVSSDIRLAKSKIQQQDSQSIIYDMSLYSLLEARHKLKTMVRNGELEITTAELNRSLCSNLRELALALERQIASAELWQTGDRCPQCELKLMPLKESCICGCKINSKGDRLENRDLTFLIAENCTE
ncbi:MAG: hypothetical protein AAFY50_02630 [Cyanobacteria bacterium J06648_1]